MPEKAVNLSNLKLSNADVSLLSKGFKFYPTPNGVDKSVIKVVLEKFGRILRLK